MRRILNVIGSLNVGGAEINAVNIFKNLDHTKYQYDFLVFDKEKGDFEEEVKALGASVIRLDEPKQGYPKFIKDFGQLLKANKYDIVHVNTLWNSGLLLRIAKANKVPIRIAHSHSTDSSVDENNLYKMYKTSMRQLIRRYGNVFIGCGIDAGNYLFGEEFFNKHGQIIYNGVDLEKFRFNQSKRESIRNEVGMNEDEFLLGHVGRLAPVKNHTFMIEIMKRLSTQDNKMKLAFTGDGPDKDSITREIKEAGLESNVILLGKRKDVDSVVKAYDLMLFPSLFEGFPLTLIEAQASGLPALISANVTNEAVVTRESKRIPLDDMDEWVENILRIKKASIIREDIDISKIEEEFEVKKIAKKWEMIYDKEI